MKGEDIAGRLLEFAVRVLRLVRTLRSDAVARHVSRQPLRAATSGGANYEEARSAESRADFAHKAGVAAKELSESRYWLRLISRVELAPKSAPGPLIAEAGELLAILTASAKTAKRSPT